MAMGIVANISGAADLICQNCGAVQMSSFAPLLLQLRHGGAAVTACPYCGVPHADSPYALGIEMEATPLAVPAVQPAQVPQPLPGAGDGDDPPVITAPEHGPFYLEIILPGQVSPFTTLHLGAHPPQGWPRYDRYDLLTQEMSRILAPPMPLGMSQLIWSGPKPLALARLATDIATATGAMPSIAVRPATYGLLSARGATLPPAVTS